MGEELAQANKKMTTSRQIEKRRAREQKRKEQIRAKKIAMQEDDDDKAFGVYNAPEKIAFGDINERPPEFQRGGRINASMGSSMEEFARRAASMAIPKMPKSKKEMRMNF